MLQEHWVLELRHRDLCARFEGIRRTGVLAVGGKQRSAQASIMKDGRG